ncbi:MAG: hypothetical protein WA172_18500 [Terriglobales bacterium]
MLRFHLLVGVLCPMLLPTISLAAKHVEPVSAVASQGFRVSTPQGSAVEPFIISVDWSKPQPKITRAVIIFHGKGRDAEGYYRTAMEAAEDAGSAARETVFVAPQFLDEEDIGARRVPEEVLRWHRTDWESGAPAVAPIPVSSYEIVDALLTRLTDTSFFPNLKIVVLAGHSGGGQLLQRYAVVGRAAAAIVKSGIRLRFVIANPSSYVYFSDERPAASGMLAPFKGDGCRDFNRWKYGIIDAPTYMKLDATNTWAQLEASYAQRDVIYLLGTADTDPHEKDLDVSCGGEAQGSTRFARGQAYYAYLHNRNRAGWNQRMWFVPGVAHSAHKMFTSTCGVNALFDAGRCPDQ